VKLRGYSNQEHFYVSEERAVKTSQMSIWAEQFGRDYTDRNSLALQELDALYKKNYGVTRRQLNKRFLNDIPFAASILEVGCNIGNQLSMLSQLGYSRLSGIELQHYALLRAQQRLRNVHLIAASALEIPFADNSFDVVFTSGVLIHIAPPDLPQAMAEIYRCTRKYIWGLEYYASETSEVQYRGHNSLLWKADYARLYLERFMDLGLSRCERLLYPDGDKEDRMFLLQKKAARK
jgi:pseudaminic acid biosynthesis-associated methylase